MVNNILNIIYNILSNEMFLTIFSGIIVFIFSQLIIEKIIKPKDKFNELKGKIFFCLIMYSNLFANPIKLDIHNSVYMNASESIRKIASEFAGHLESHPLVCRKKKYYDVVNKLIFLSNGVFRILDETSTINKNRECIDYIYKKFNSKERFF